VVNSSFPTICTAFSGTRQIATGGLQEVALKAQESLNRDPSASVLIFDDQTSQVIEVDLRGTAESLKQRIAAVEPAPQPANDLVRPDEGARKPGRPKLGVVAREVTLLPRHWDWLATQSGGASVALRRLVEEARKTNQGRDRRRLALESVYRFISAMAGNEPGFEEATRALFAGDQRRFGQLVGPWPIEIGSHAKKLAERALNAPNSTHPTS
jgi:hypothetical protein